MGFLESDTVGSPHLYAHRFRINGTLIRGVQEDQQGQEPCQLTVNMRKIDFHRPAHPLQIIRHAGSFMHIPKHADIWRQAALPHNLRKHEFQKCENKTDPPAMAAELTTA